MMFQITIDINSLLYADLPCETLSERISKAKLIAGVSQHELAKLTGLSRATINELEAGYREIITRDTLIKLIQVLDPEILCDDYLKFILNQGVNINNLINKFGITKLAEILNVHHSTIYRWKECRYTLPRKKYNEIIKISQD